MNWLGALWALYKFELTSASRERNVLLYVIMIPALLYPLMVWFTMSTLSFLIGLSEQQVCRVQIVGLPATMSSLPKSLHQEHKTWDIQTLETDNQDSKVDLKLTFAEPQGPIRVFATYDSRSARSVNCKEQFESFFLRYRDYWAEQEIRNSGLPLWEFQPFTVQYFNESKAADVGKGKITWKGKEVVTETPHQSKEPIKATVTIPAPKSMDFTRANGPDAGKTMRAIYEFRSPDEYVIVFAPAGKDRPQALDSKPGSGTYMHVWKRQK